MSQFDFGTIDPDDTDGVELSDYLNQWRDAIISSHKGPSRPAYAPAEGGFFWVKEVSGTAEEWYWYDGTQDSLIGTLNPTTGEFVLSLSCPVSDKSGNYTAVASDRGRCLNFTAAATLTLDDAVDMGLNWFAEVKASDSGDVEVTPTTGTINGESTITIRGGQSGKIIRNGSNFIALLGGGGPGQQKKQFFSSDAGTAGPDFTPGVTTTLTITETPAPASPDALVIEFDGIGQYDWSYDAGTNVVTFDEAIPLGTLDIAMFWNGAVDIGEPADGTVSAAKTTYSMINGQTAETAPAVGDLVLLGDVSAGALRKMTLPNLLKVINGLSEETTPDSTADFLLLYDTSEGAVNKVKPENIAPQQFAGAVVQSIVGTYTASADLTTAIPFDDTIPQNTEGTQIISVSITPKSTANKLRIRFSGNIGVSNTFAAVAAFKDSDVNAVGASATFVASGAQAQIALEFELSPATLSAVTIAIRAGGISTTRMNGISTGRRMGGVAISTLILEEIKV